MSKFEVVGFSITTDPDTKGTDAEGNPSVGRHWYRGSVVELSQAEAAFLFEAGAIQPAGAKLALKPAASLDEAMGLPPVAEPNELAPEAKTDPEVPQAKKAAKK